MTDAVTLADVVVMRAGKMVVCELSATIARGKWFGVVGANGSGKTTFLRAVAGRLPIASGSCRIEDSELALDRTARAERIGFAPPIEHLPSSLRLDELLSLAAGDWNEPRERCSHLWGALGIDRLLGKRIGEYSSGMRQRASIALAFAKATPIVILDEPFNWLDPVAAFDARSALRKMVSGGLTLITALHDLTTLCGSCDAGMLMTEGRPTLHLHEEELRLGQNDARAFERKMIAALREG